MYIYILKGKAKITMFWKLLRQNFKGHHLAVFEMLSRKQSRPDRSINMSLREIEGFLRLKKRTLFAWAISFGLFYAISLQFDVFLSLVTLQEWLLCSGLFLVFSRFYP